MTEQIRQAMMEREISTAKIYSNCIEIEDVIKEEITPKKRKLLKEALAFVIISEESFYNIAKISGGYCNIKVDEMESDSDDDTDEDFDWFMFWVETGEDGEGYRKSSEAYCKISSRVVYDKTMLPSEKAEKVEKA